MSDLFFRSLPAIDTVAVFQVVTHDVSSVSDYVRDAQGAVSAVVAGSQAEQIAALWRSLPTGMQDRGHTPPYVLVFYGASTELLRASLCWESNTVSGQRDGVRSGTAFEGKRPAAVQLLGLLKSLFNHQRPAEEPTGMA